METRSGIRDQTTSSASSPMPSGMVAVPGNEFPPAADGARNPQVMKTLSAALIPQWNPRSGRGPRHGGWGGFLSRFGGVFYQNVS